MALNQVNIMGNLTRDVEVRYTPKGTAVADLGLAVNEIRKDDQGNTIESTVFVDVTAWGRTAEIAGEYLTKGSPVLLEGKLALDSWTDKETGQKRSKLKVVCERLHLIGRKRESDPSEPAERPPARSAGTRAPARTPAPRPPADPDLDAEDDAPPF